MSDIVQRLTELSKSMMEGYPLNDGDFTDIDEAIMLIERLKQERDEARQEVCFLLSRTDLNVTPGCDGDTPEFHATARGWVYLFEKEDGDKI